LIGDAIEKAAATLAFHQWRLTPAALPLDATSDSSEGAESEGLISELIGKPAAEFELELVDGKKFQLAEQKGKIVVLDFWASWCGPCLQAIPQVDTVAREFAHEDVVLVAVNLEETAEQVTAALQRLRLSPIAALDRNGRVAEKYGVTAIPQTVIIDR